MNGSLLLAASVGCNLFVNKRIEGVHLQQQNLIELIRKSNKNRKEHPITRAEALQAVKHARFPWSSRISDMFIYSRIFPTNQLPNIAKRKALFAEFSRNVSLLREAKIASNMPIRFIDKVDCSLNITTVRSMKVRDAIDTYKRQIRYLSIFTKDPDLFALLRDLISHASVYSRPDNSDVDSGQKFAGTFPLFLQDYYFSLYLPNEREWQLYVLQQRRALNEIEKNISIFFKPDRCNWIVDENGEVTITIFSTFGLDLLANLLKPDRMISSQIEQYQMAFTDKIWKNYFPYTWALVNQKAARKDINKWAEELPDKEK